MSGRRNSNKPSKVDLNKKSDNPPGTWDPYGAQSPEKKQSGQRKVSTTSGASSEGETKFGPDKLFEETPQDGPDGTSPAPNKKGRPTFKSMKHKFAKSVGLGTKVKPELVEVQDTPLSPLTDPPALEHSSSGLSTQQRGDPKRRGSDQPLSPNRMPTLESYETPNDEGGAEETTIQSDVTGQQLNLSSSSSEPRASPLPLGQSDDQGKQGSTEDKKKQEDGMQRAAQRSRDTGHKALTNKIAEVNRLSGKLETKETELKDLQTKFAAKEVACNELQTKLDDRDAAHEEHVQMKLDELRASHKIALTAKESTLQEALNQKDTELQSAEDELTKKEEEFQKQLKLKEDAYQAAVRSMVGKEAELLRLQTEIKDKQTELQNNRHEHETIVKKLEQQMEESQSEHAKAIENFEKQVKELSMEIQEAESKHTQQLADSKTEHAVDIENLRLQFLVEKESEVEKTREDLEEKYKDERRVHQVEADNLEKNDEIEQLKLQLTDPQLDRTTAVEKLEKQLSEVQAKLDQKNEANQETKVQLEADAQRKIEELEEQLSEVQAKLKQAETDQETKGQLDADAQRKIEELQQQVKEAQEESERLAKEKNMDMEKRIAAVQETLKAEHDQEVENLETDFDREKRELTDQLKQSRDKVLQLQQAHAVQIDDLQQKAETQQEEPAPTEEQRTAIEVELREKFEESLADKTREITHLTQQLALAGQQSDKRVEALQRMFERKAEENAQRHKVALSKLQQQREEARHNAVKLEKGYLAKLEEARKQRDLFAAEMAQGQDDDTATSPEKLKADLEIEIESKYQQQLEQLRQAKDELSQQLKTAESELVRNRYPPPDDNLSQLLQEKTIEVQRLTRELNSQQELVHHFQHEYEHLKEQYGQLKVQALAKQHLSGSFIPSEGDDVAMPFPTSPPQQRQPKPAAAKDTEVTIHSSLVEAANQISKFIDNESLNGNSKEKRLGHQQTTAATKALGLQVTPKPQYYVFAVFPASQHNYSTVLDYTAGSPIGGEREGRHESDEEDEFHQALESLSEQREMQGENDNRTDAEKLEEEKKRSESLLDELETLTNRLQELEATNTELKETVRVSATKVPPFQAGVKQGEDPSKMFQQMKSRYLEQVTKTIDAQEAHKQELDKLVQQHQKELQEWQVRYDRKKQELTEKIQEKDREVRELRTQDSVQDHPLLRQSFSCEDLPDDIDPKLHIAELRQALKDKEEKVDSLSVQVSSFQKIASQHQQLESHVKLQSTSVMQLKRELEATKDELEASRKSSLKVSESNEELSKLQKEKYEIEDERDILKQEMDAERDNVKSLKEQNYDKPRTGLDSTAFTL